MNAVTYADIDALYRGNNANESAAEVIERRGRLVVNANIPAVVSNVSQVLIARGRTQAAIQPIWANIGIEDVYSNSKSGQIAFTAITLTDFSVQHPAGLRLGEEQQQLKVRLTVRCGSNREAYHHQHGG